MDNFTDEYGMNWIKVWDSTSHSYSWKPSAHLDKPDWSHATGGDSLLFDPSQRDYTEYPQNPLQEGFLASAEEAFRGTAGSGEFKPGREAFITYDYSPFEGLVRGTPVTLIRPLSQDVWGVRTQDGKEHAMRRMQLMVPPQFPEPSGSTVPDTIPWGEAEQDYYRHASPMYPPKREPDPQVNIQDYLEAAQGNTTAAAQLIRQDLMDKYGYESQTAWNIAMRLMDNYTNQQPNMNNLPAFPDPTGATVPDTLPWGEAEQEYYRHAAIENQHQFQIGEAVRYKNPIHPATGPPVETGIIRNGPKQIVQGDPDFWYEVGGQNHAPNWVRVQNLIPLEEPGLEQEGINQLWPDTLPWSEQEQDYYRRAQVYSPGHPDECDCDQCKFQKEMMQQPLTNYQTQPFVNREPHRDWERIDDTFPSMPSRDSGFRFDDPNKMDMLQYLRTPFIVSGGKLQMGIPGQMHGDLPGYREAFAPGGPGAQAFEHVGEIGPSGNIHMHKGDLHPQLEQQLRRELINRQNAFLTSSTSSVTSGDSMTDYSHIPSWEETINKEAADLDSCPDCGDVMMDQGGEKACHGCGNRQPIIYAKGKTAQGPLLPLEIGAIGDLVGGGAAAGGAEALGAGAAAGGTEAGGTGLAGSLMNGAMNVGKGVGNLAMSPGPAGMLTRHELFNAVSPGQSQGDQGAGMLQGGVPGVDAPMLNTAVPPTLSKRAADDSEMRDKSVGTEMRGDDSNPDVEGIGGYSDEHGDSPDILKDVNPQGGTQGLRALEMFQLALPLVMHFNSSDESGEDNPILQALDKALEAEFPGYRQNVGAHPDANASKSSPKSENKSDKSDSGEKSEPKKKESAGMGANQQNLPAQPQQGAAQQQTQQLGAPALPPCPICGGAHDPAIAHGQASPQQQMGFGGPGAFMSYVSQIEKIAARRPKMCPYHNDLVDYSLTLGDPATALTSLTPNAYGASWCKSGDFEGKCNFRADMVKQEYWDNKDQEAQERREQREQEMQMMQQEQPVDQFNDDPVPAEHFEQAIDNVTEVDFGGHNPEPGTDTAVQGMPMAAKTAANPYEGILGDSGQGYPNSLDYNDLTGADTQPSAEVESAIRLLQQHGYQVEPPQGQGAGYPVDMPNDIGLQSFNSSTKTSTIWNDNVGQPLVEGQTYQMRSPQYQIPDEVTVDKITPNKIEVTVHGDLGMDYKDEISPDQLDAFAFSFEPKVRTMEQEHQFSPEQNHDAPVGDIADPSQADDLTGGGQDRGWLMDEQSGGDFEGVDPGVLAKLAGKDFNYNEQKAFIDEPGVARNSGKLDLAGTHYEDFGFGQDHDVDVEFLWS